MRCDTSLNTTVLKDLLSVRYGSGHSCCARNELAVLLHCLAPGVEGDRLEIGTDKVLLAQRLLYLFRHTLGRKHPLRLEQRPCTGSNGRHHIRVCVPLSGADPLPGLGGSSASSPVSGPRYEAGAPSPAQVGSAGLPAPGGTCCSTAAARAAYWYGGHLSSPRTGFHVELTLPPADRGERLLRLLSGVRPLDNFRSMRRRERHVFYAKSAQVIIDFLCRLGATTAVLLLQDIIITKEIKNDVNRTVNAELGNLRRSSASSAADVEAVAFLEDRGILQDLPKGLRTVAEARRRHPGLSLKELGRRLDPPLSKTGVFHRLRRLRQAAETERKRT